MSRSPVGQPPSLWLCESCACFHFKLLQPMGETGYCWTHAQSVVGYSGGKIPIEQVFPRSLTVHHHQPAEVVAQSTRTAVLALFILVVVSCANAKIDTRALHGSDQATERSWNERTIQYDDGRTVFSCMSQSVEFVAFCVSCPSSQTSKPTAGQAIEYVRRACIVRRILLGARRHDQRVDHEDDIGVTWSTVELIRTKNSLVAFSVPKPSWFSH